MDSVPVCLSELPLSNIRVSPSTSPHSRTMLQTVHPFALIRLSVCPYISSQSFRLSVHIAPLVLRVITKSLISFAVLEVVLPRALVHPAVMIDHHSFAMSLVIKKLPIIDALFISFQLESGGAIQLRNAEI